MHRILLLSFLFLTGACCAQDSLVVKIHPAYGHANGVHRWLLGANYRKEWSMDVRVPVIHLSQFKGGLTPEKLGGGMQSKSLRMTDPDSREWVIRSVEKIPDLVVPERLRQTFAKDLVDDATSAQHPFAALLVPPVADAVQVLHTNPIIGYIADDPALGQYEKTFAGTVVLLEERAPYKKTANSIDMVQALNADNANTYDAVAYLKARMIDLLFADWDRHEDQWRWRAVPDGTGEKYLPIPRDRDQVVSVTEGVIPSLVKDLYTMPRVPGFTQKMRKPRHYFFKSSFLNARPASQFSHEQWAATVKEFVSAITDEVLEKSLARLPEPVYRLRHDEFLRKLKARRDALPAAMEDYYAFVNQVVDIQLSDKDEQVVFSDSSDGLRLVVRQAGTGKLLMDKTYSPTLTKQIRVYTLGGNDSIFYGGVHSAITVRLITAEGSKKVGLAPTGKALRLYGRTDNITVSGDLSAARQHLSNDTANTNFHPVNLYNLTFPLINAGLNSDDGFLFGGGFRFLRQKGFRQEPYSAMYQLMLTHSFSTDAFKLAFHGEWIRAIGKADVVLQTQVNKPNNTINFFGLGNETEYVKSAGIKYYRTRFSTYELAPALRWRDKRDWSVSVGPALQYYDYEAGDNKGRFINQQSLIGTYDSATIDKSKLHLGGRLNFTYDNRKGAILPTSGFLVSATLTAYKGRGDYARDYGQFTPEFSFYQSLNVARTLVISDRIGGIVSLGHPAFYQAAFLGGQGNLLGYRQYRFAGRNAVFNNFELRLKLADVSSYIFPGELGLSGFFDIGRVWAYNDHSDTWHNGQGGGIYYAPAQLVVFKLIAGHSNEGWYPYISMGMRF